MPIVTALQIDLDTTPIGTRSRLADDLLGEPVLVRTIRRLRRARRVDGVFVLCAPAERDRVAALTDGLDVSVETHNAGPAPHQQLIQSARKWSLDAWRGGIGGACAFDEYVHPPLLDGLAKREKAQAVVVVPPAAVLIDPELVDALIDHYVDVHEQMRMVFTQAPPGLSPVVLSAELLTTLAQNRVAPGVVLAYKPDSPEGDLITKDCCYAIPAEVIHVGGRFIADCSRGVERVTAALEAAAGSDPTVLDLARWARRYESGRVETLPREVEIELTTDDPLAQTALRPRGADVGSRGPIEAGLVRALAEQLARYDDSLVVLGGFGDPLAHPRFDDVVGCLRDSGVYGLAVRTPAVYLDAATIDVLFERRVDVVNVLLDAATPQVYRQVHNTDHFDAVIANINALAQARISRRQAAPLIVPEMVKDNTTVEQMEAFFDEWITRVGWVVVDGYSHYAGQLEDRSVVNMAPPQRVACRRIFSRCTVLADGCVIPCDRDFKGQHAVGSLLDTALADLWGEPSMNDLRRSHQAGDYAAMLLCSRCDDWDRP